MNRPPSDVIRTLLRTEKGTRALVDRKYLFAVDLAATKPQIKRAVEELFKVKVTKVTTAVVQGKPRRVGFRWGYEPDWKRALVTLAEGSKIEVAA
ncbi:MAG: 50S ribosomal protein L23 [Candidatus Omnitrophica bacterium]|nr:50S ribosomal protein L23 [Candidatus Omnitrophota bacterium]